MHIHVPDGVFPAWLWVGCIAIIIPLIGLALIMVRKDQKKLVMTSAITALMLIVFSLEFFGFHLNFTTLSGMILGPWWSLISITVTNIFLALFGHGGLTVAPVNIIVNWVEALIGFALFRLVAARIKNTDAKSAVTGLIVAVALAASFALFIWVISLTGINPGSQLEDKGTSYVPLKEFVAISILPAAVGAAIEAVLTALMVRFIIKTQPGLLK